jgi:hypothetical protein
VKRKEEGEVGRREFIAMAASVCLSATSWPQPVQSTPSQLNRTAEAGLEENAKQVRILSNSSSSFRIQTGEYEVSFAHGVPFLFIQRKGADRGLALRPAGDAGFSILGGRDARVVRCVEERDAICVEVSGSLPWGTGKITLRTHHETPGLINSAIEVVLNRDIAGTDDAFLGEHAELTYPGDSSDLSLTYYLNGTPGARTYHTAEQHESAILDNNQWIYWGDPVILKSTLLYFEDFTSLSSFYEMTGTRLRKTIRQPPDCLDEPQGVPGSPFSFGYVLPKFVKSLQQGSRVLLANSFLYIEPGSPSISESEAYCSRFIDGVSAIYPHLDKPENKMWDWVAITEKGLGDLTVCEEALRKRADADPHQTPAIPESMLRSPIDVPSNLISIQRYASTFHSKRAQMLVGDAEKRWANLPEPRLPYGDAWQYLFPMIMAGEYAQEFHSNAAKSFCLRGSADVVETGQRLQYIFPLRINQDFSKTADVRYQYDCTGAYVYLMLLYSQFTGEVKYISEARAAADRLLQMGFELPYEFTTTSLAPVALLRLYKTTGDRRYLDGIAIPMAAILRHSCFFNPGYREYKGRTIFLLTEAMPGVYANGWEEACLVHYLNVLLQEGGDVLQNTLIEMASELLRWKGVSLLDSLAPSLPETAVVNEKTPREWFIPVNRTWDIPLEGFGYLEWDDSGQSDKLGSVSQGFYTFGVLPEIAALLFHPLIGDAMLYAETPITLTKNVGETFRVSTIAGKGPVKAFLKTDPAYMVHLNDARGMPIRVHAEENGSQHRLWFEMASCAEYTIHFELHTSRT